MSAPLTPESEALLERFHVAEEAMADHECGDETFDGFALGCGEVQDALAAIEAAAIARYADGLAYRADECCSGCEEPSGHRAIPEAQEADRG